MMTLVAFMALNLTSCSSEDPVPMPTVQILADIDPADQYKVNITVQATDATTYAWTYGDGESSIETGNHSHTYAAAGTYIITVTITNETGSKSDTKEVTINPSLAEMIAGVDPAGKSWVLTTTPSPTDGAGPLAETEFNATLPFAFVPTEPAGNVLEFVGCPDEYDNIFTFKPDGGYAIDNVNGQNLCTEIFATIAQSQDQTIDWTKGSMGFAFMPYAISPDATWAVEEDATIALDISSEDPAVADPVYTDLSVSYSGVTKLSITNGYFGMLDLSNNVIIESISPTEMRVILIMHTTNMDKPSIFSRFTMVPAE
jgi:hypothetical protein